MKDGSLCKQLKRIKPSELNFRGFKVGGRAYYSFSSTFQYAWSMNSFQDA